MKERISFSIWFSEVRICLFVSGWNLLNKGPFFKSSILHCELYLVAILKLRNSCLALPDSKSLQVFSKTFLNYTFIKPSNSSWVGLCSVNFLISYCQLRFFCFFRGVSLFIYSLVSAIIISFVILGSRSFKIY